MPAAMVHDESKSETEPWPPKPPDVSLSNLNDLEPSPFAVSANGHLYKFKSCSKVYKDRAWQREYDMQKAAGDCSVKVYGRSLTRDSNGQVHARGFIMDLATPLDPKKIKPSMRRVVMESMIYVVLKLHCKKMVHGDIKLANMLLCAEGDVRLCDFAEARYLDEDPSEWEGQVTVNYMSPKRCRNWPDKSDPAPTVEDDLYGLGLSIWELYTGQTPFEDVYMDDIMDAVKLGGTVDVDEVKDAAVREIIRHFLRAGSAKV